MTRTADFVLPLFTVIFGSTASTMSAIILFIVIYHQHKNRIKQEERIILILCVNIYFCIFFSSTMLLILNIETLLGDLYGLNFDSTQCVFLGYLNAVLICTFFYGFVTQAFYRLCRIVYPSYKWLQTYWIYIFAVPLQLIMACLLMCPIYFWHAIVYMPGLYHCFVPVQNILGTVWLIIFMYGLPVFCLSAIYIRITRYIRQQSTSQTLATKHRQARDFVVIKRIMIIISILFTLGVPGIILMIISYITENKYPQNYRVSWLTLELFMIILNILMIVMTPQLKTIVVSKWKRNRVISIVATVGNSAPTRTVATLQ
ncbi:unnamed protein product [Adineta steineri]|uniref:G-protein coupled receptors family 1 profile domain-containing protein n=1 Tax=Adineta steineri TaxID=433720 RepID=A0A813NQE6_9BILA|nr:unnamed protein product [Adineta steineri]CAF3537930.1 unnamed protein product [Adineta steineri]